MSPSPRDTGRYLRFLWRAYQRDHCGQAAASLAFQTLLSLVPLVALLAWLTRPFHASLAEAMRPLLHYFSPTPELLEVVQTNIARYAANAGKMGVLGLAFFLFVAWGILQSVESVLNDVWGVVQKHGRVKRLARFWVAVFLAPALFLAGAALNHGLEQQLILRGLMERPFFAWLLADLLPFLLLVASLFLAYWRLPHVRVSLRAALGGALVASLLYVLMRWLFGLYVGNFATYDRIYGLLWVIPAFMAWLFGVWSVLLVGAEVAWSVDHPRDGARGP